MWRHPMDLQNAWGETDKTEGEIEEAPGTVGNFSSPFPENTEPVDTKHHVGSTWHLNFFF